PGCADAAAEAAGGSGGHQMPPPWVPVPVQGLQRFQTWTVLPSVRVVWVLPPAPPQLVQVRGLVLGLGVGTLRWAMGGLVSCGESLGRCVEARPGLVLLWGVVGVSGPSRRGVGWPTPVDDTRHGAPCADLRSGGEVAGMGEERDDARQAA